jgi:hypothetical protein
LRPNFGEMLGTGQPLGFGHSSAALPIPPAARLGELSCHCL